MLVNNASLNIAAKAPIKSPFVMQCAMHADDSLNGLVACAGMKNLVEIWGLESSSPLPVKKKDFEGHEGYISQIHFLKNGRELLTGSGDGYAMLWDLEKMCLKQTFEGHEQDEHAIAAWHR